MAQPPCLGCRSPRLSLNGHRRLPASNQSHAEQRDTFRTHITHQAPAPTTWPAPARTAPLTPVRAVRRAGNRAPGEMSVMSPL